MIVHLVPSVASGGAPQGALDLMLAQRARGMESCMWVMQKNAAVPNSLDGLPIQYLDIEYTFSKRAERASSIMSLRRRIAEMQPDLVHSHLMPADYIAAYASSGICRHLAHIRDTQPWLASHLPRNLWKRAMYSIAFRRAKTRFVAVSRAAGEYHRRHLWLRKSSVEIVLNGVEGKRFAEMKASTDPNWVTFGTVGRLSPEKGHLELLDAFSKLPSHARLIIVGHGSQELLLRERVRQLDIEGRVEFLTSFSPMEEFYCKLDVFVLASKSSEGLARVIMEAMWSGLPIVATDVAGTSEAIEEGKTGWIVKKGCSDSLALAMHDALNANIRLRMGQCGRATAITRFSLDRVEREVASVYRSLGVPS